MKNKHITAWILILTLTAAILCGCGGSQYATAPQPSTTVAAPEPTETPAPTETQPPQTEAPTQPPETAAPMEPAPVLVDITPDDRYALNTFLSNFSEQWFHEGYVWYKTRSDTTFRSDSAEVKDIVGFVWLHAKINCYSDLEVVQNGDNYYYAFKLSLLSASAERFFGRTLNEAELPTDESADFFLLDGMVCGPAADGESYTNMTVTEQVYDLGDGTFMAEFTIYDAWALAERDEAAFEEDVYYLTGGEARNHPDLTQHLTGAAVIRPHTLEDGQKTYQLVSYELFTPAE